ncbi:MAG: MarR family transcriptional regulator [Treponema sp.]|nr:MarR family transcriptional regulator [Treponema sp.]
MDKKDMVLHEKFQLLEMMLFRYGQQHFGTLGNPMRGQGRILRILKLKNAISQKELSYLLAMRNQSLSEIIAKLEKNGCITKTPSEEDRRTGIIRITDKGMAAAEAMEGRYAQAPDMFACLREEEQKTFGEYLDRIITVLETQLGTTDNRNGDFGPTAGDLVQDSGDTG